MKRARSAAGPPSLEGEDLDLPPLLGGHEPPPPPPPPLPKPTLPEFFVATTSSSEEPAAGQRHRPSQRRHRAETPPPPPSADEPWEAANSWMQSTFARFHVLLRPALEAYLNDGSGSSKRCKSADGFYKAFWEKEKRRCGKALATAVQFLLMEHWRARLVAKLEQMPPPSALAPALAAGGGRRAVRDLVDPVLQAASAEAAEAKVHHRESLEFAEAVVCAAAASLRKRALEAL